MRIPMKAATRKVGVRRTFAMRDVFPYVPVKWH